MKLALTLSLLSFSGIQAGPASLRGEHDVTGPFANLKCTLAAYSNQDKCKEATTDDGEPCSYCVTTSNGQEAGICVNPDIGEQMQELNPSITCGPAAIDSAKAVTDYSNDFKCTLSALTDSDKCSKSKADDDQWCEFCAIDGPFGKQGLCVSPEHAEAMKEHSSGAVSCMSHHGISTGGNHEITGTDTDVASPIIDCNISGYDHDACLDPTKVKGADCVWCDAQIGGFCFPKGWEDTVSNYLDCERASEDSESASQDNERASEDEDAHELWMKKIDASTW